ncbi:protease modulator HflC [Paraferrimonas sedimenticola]|uniref:Protein HflC n=1 Tax=Paraferrimonas sedimenticola TaxID=375674 RepID=A0AA37RZ98_9GAMM|nr:protease modulator HflC [Paraferrimonas sedimenticola]GLP98045.1 protein HflC [Paraferrimonas sedimenticola]
MSMTNLLSTKVKWAAIAVVGLGFLAFDSLIIVKEGQQAVISQFGSPVKVIDQAGLVVKMPTPVQTVTHIDSRAQVLSLPHNEYGTSDRSNLVVENFIVWKIADPIRYLTSVGNKEVASTRLSALVNAEVGIAISSVNLPTLFGMAEQDKSVKSLFAEITTKVDAKAQRELGIEVTSLRAKRLGFPIQSLASIYNRMESEWQHLEKKYIAEGEELAASIRAETDRLVSEIEAKAYRDGQIIRGESEALAAATYADAYQSNADYFTFTRYMETYEKVLKDNATLILPTDLPLFEQFFETPKVKK